MLTQQAPPTKPPPTPKLTRAAQRDTVVLDRLNVYRARHPEQPALTRDQLAALFGVKPMTITRWARFIVGALPRYLPDGQVKLPRNPALHLFHVNDVATWVIDGHAPHAGRTAGG